MSKHTQGPWIFEPEYNTVLNTDCSRTIAYLLPGGFDEPEHDEVDWELLRANARLIAAAPEMLRLIQRLTSPHMAEPDYRAEALIDAYDLVKQLKNDD